MLENAAPSQRDSAVEDEVFHCGYFADVVFQCQVADSGEVESIYGQAGLFALHSPPLRRLIEAAAAAGGNNGEVASLSSGLPWDGRRRLEVCLNDLGNAHGFREVARYVYRLAPRFTTQQLPDVIHAAQALELMELRQSALDWGLRELEAQRRQGGTVVEGVEAVGRVDDALRCFETLCSFIGIGAPEVAEADAVRWRESLLAAYRPAEILASPALMGLSPEALRTLFEGQALHGDPAAAWLTCLTWAKARASAGALGGGAGLQAAASAAEVVSRRVPMRGARLAIAPAPAPPPEAEVAWQRCLLPAASAIRFSSMSPADFAKHVELLDPILPELRQVIYASRRRFKHEDSVAAPLPAPPQQAPLATLATAVSVA